MNQHQIVLKTIRDSIKSMSAEDREAVEELADFIRANIKTAGPVVGPFALALVGAEAAAQED